MNPDALIDTTEPTPPTLHIVFWETCPHPFLVVWPAEEGKLGTVIATADSDEEADGIRRIWLEAWQHGWHAGRGTVDALP